MLKRLILQIDRYIYNSYHRVLLVGVLQVDTVSVPEQGAVHLYQTVFLIGPHVAIATSVSIHII